MAKHKFKFWVEVERFDEEQDDWISCTGQDKEIYIEPVPLGNVECTEEEARAIAESFDYLTNPGLLEARAAERTHEGQPRHDHNRNP